MNKTANSEINQQLANAIREMFGPDSWVMDYDLDENWVVYQRNGPGATGSFRLSFALANDTVELGAEQPTEVTASTSYVPASVKFVKGSDSLIEGLAIPFGGPFAGKDFDGEDFGPDTDYAFDLYPLGRPLLYDHGIDAKVKLTVQGRQIEHDVRDEGVWAQAQLDKSAKYHATVTKLIAAGKLFFSSGSVPHLVETTADGHIKRWPWTELSLTPTPANPWAAVHAVKMTDVLEHTRAADLEVPGELIAAALKALDAIPNDENNALPDGAKFADLIDRLSVDGPVWVKARQDWFAKSGRRLSAAMRERLADRPLTLRQLADDIDGLLHVADPAAEKKAIDALVAAAAEQEARLQDSLRH